MKICTEFKKYCEYFLKIISVESPHKSRNENKKNNPEIIIYNKGGGNEDKTLK